MSGRRADASTPRPARPMRAAAIVTMKTSAYQDRRISR
ncbi:hypothetical protein BSIN_4110 [Burkholderia singularis]|uniref:Uncharacterized protein n=1 Tax=Burkholderia singularis TaxID=1503053 RepID=A0A238HCT4_9BURK|nr:hypothetical protein BSIN_4110 [Burkholderia singularis]